LALQCFHRQYLNPNVYLVSNVEREVLYEKIVGNKGVLSELNLNSNAVLDEISLVVTVYGLLTRSFDLLFLIALGAAALLMAELRFHHNQGSYSYARRVLAAPRTASCGKPSLPRGILATL